MGLNLKKSWGGAQAQARGLKLHHGRRAYFVIGEESAGPFIDWLKRRSAAEKEIGAYLRKASPLLGGETPFYKVDDNGYVVSINFRYGMGLTHFGWKGIEGTNWLEPEDPKITGELRALPPLPSYSELNRMIGWPEPCLSDMFSDRHLPGYDDFAQRAVRAVDLARLGKGVWLGVPFPETFADYPPLRAAVQDWRPPQFMHQITEQQGRLLKYRNGVCGHPLVTAAKRILSL